MDERTELDLQSTTMLEEKQTVYLTMTLPAPSGVTSTAGANEYAAKLNISPATTV
jgi:hypothetical protein